MGKLRAPVRANGQDRANKIRRVMALRAKMIRAEEDYLVGVAEAIDGGLTFRDIAMNVGIAESSVRKHKEFGDSIRSERGSADPDGPRERNPNSRAGGRADRRLASNRTTVGRG